MRSSADKEWTEKLQPAALAANTQVKRSTRHTEFYLMFGRDYDSSNLLNLVTSTSTSKPSLNPLENIEDASYPEISQNTTKETDPYQLPRDENEWIKVIDENRTTDWKLSIVSIKEEQKTQKRIFDRKVKRNRLVRNHVYLIIYITFASLGDIHFSLKLHKMIQCCLPNNSYNNSYFQFPCKI